MLPKPPIVQVQLEEYQRHPSKEMLFTAAGDVVLNGIVPRTDQRAYDILELARHLGVAVRAAGDLVVAVYCLPAIRQRDRLLVQVEGV